MPNINREITLNSKGVNAGPYYDVYYSTDCISYTIAVDGTNVYLPNVGSTVIVTVDSATQCLKLVNKTTGCNNNEVIESFTTTTTSTTSTTTTSTTTSTTTTTTQAPTTTSTTLFCAGSSCKNWQYNNVPVGGDTIHYWSCATGDTQTLIVSEGNTGTFCNCNTSGTPYADSSTQLTEIGTC